MAAGQQLPLGLYIHLPWCERKCPYCDFNSHQAGALPEQRYIDSLLRDLETQAGYCSDRAVRTLFIGGGTPSLFSVAAIERLMRGVGELVDLVPGLEATLEANPGSAESEKFAGFRQAGINRLSLGIQSFDDACLDALGRVHNSAQAHGAIEMARSAGFERINLDLMHGLPGQSVDAACADLDCALAYDTGHLSWYQLTIEPNTAFHSDPPALPVENTLADIQAAGEVRLGAAGYRAYEVSAWCREQQQCRHNLNYWRFGDYLAIGAGAHGKLTFPEQGRIWRYWQTRLPQDYMSRDRDFLAGSRDLGAADLQFEYLMNALRLRAGFDLQQFEQRTGLDARELCSRLQQHLDTGLLQRHGSRVRTTALGRRFLDTLVADYLP